MKLNDKIRILRKMRGWSQEELGYNLSKTCKDGISRQAVSDWENDKSEPKLDNIRDLADVLGVSFDVLLDENIDLNNPDTLKEITNNKEAESKKEDTVSKKANVSYSFFEIKKHSFLMLIPFLFSVIGAAVFTYFTIKDSSTMYIIISVIFYLLTIYFLISFINWIKDFHGKTAGKIEYSYVVVYLQNARRDDIYIPYSLIDKIYAENLHGKYYGDLVFKLKDGKEYRQEKIKGPQKVVDFINNIIEEYNKD